MAWNVVSDGIAKLDYSTRYTGGGGRGGGGGGGGGGNNSSSCEA